MRFSLLALLLVACARPDVLVICHNANCVEPHDPRRDDTLDALHESLALADEGIIDGIELDLVVDGDRCLFAHDAHTDAITITAAAAIVAEHLRDPFVVELELKATDARDTSARCAREAHDIINAAAIARGVDLEVIFVSYSPALLRAMEARRPAGTKLALGVGVPPPLLDDNHSLAELDDVAPDIVEIHPGWITDTALRALRSTNAEIGAWFIDMNRETLDGVARLRPSYVLTGQARSFRSWLDG